MPDEFTGRFVAQGNDLVGVPEFDCKCVPGEPLCAGCKANELLRRVQAVERARCMAVALNRRPHAEGCDCRTCRVLLGVAGAIERGERP